MLFQVMFSLLFSNCHRMPCSLLKPLYSIMAICCPPSVLGAKSSILGLPRCQCFPNQPRCLGSPGWHAPQMALPPCCDNTLPCHRPWCEELHGRPHLLLCSSPSSQQPPFSLLLPCCHSATLQRAQCASQVQLSFFHGALGGSSLFCVSV